jgi:hypothetical protein
MFVEEIKNMEIEDVAILGSFFLMNLITSTPV